jgi:ACS family glucarate transporter-like MFS transporter
MGDKPASIDERPTNVRWLIFALACGASFFLYLHRYTWNIVGPALQQEFGFDNTTSGIVFSFFYWTYASGQIPSGVAIDWFGPHLFLVLSILLWSATLPLFGMTSRLPVVGMYRALFGAAQAGCYPGLNKATRLWFPARYRTTLQGLITASGRAGGAMSSILMLTLLMGYWGLSWQMALWALGLAGIAFGVAFALFFRTSPAEHPLANEAEAVLIQGAEPPASGEKSVLPWRDAFRNPSMRVFVCQQFLDAGSDVVFVSLIGKYFLEHHALDIKNVGWLVSLPLWGGMLGGISGGWLNDLLIALSGNRRWSRSGIGASGKFLGALLLVLLALQASPGLAGLCLFAAKFFSDWSQPTTWGSCTDLGGRCSATVFSIINTAGTLGGVVMPIVFGKVLDLFTRAATIGGETVTTTDWAPLFYVLAAMYAGSGVCWLLLDCTRTLDQTPHAQAN